MRRFVVLLLTLLTLHGVDRSAPNEKTFHSIVVEDKEPANRRTRLVDYDCGFAWLAQDFGDSCDFGGNIVPGVFVHSHSHNRWLKILRVSTEGSQFGKSPPDVLLQAPWDFTSLRSREFVPLPLPDGGLPKQDGQVIHLPDKIVFDTARQVFVMSFDSHVQKDSVITTLIIPKKDLIEAFDYFGKR